jgi:hypothetical protein
MPADALDTDDLKDVLAGGLVREDVMDEIFDNSEFPTPFLDMIGGDSFDNSYAEWTQDKLASPDITNAVISGSDSSTANNNANVANAKRLGNHAQISDKLVVVTERGNATDNIGRSDEMGYQTARRMIELRYDQEAIALSNQASVADNGDSVAGKSAGVGAWLETNTYHGATGADGGFDTGTKVVAALTPGTTRAGTWEMIATGIEDVFLQGGNPTVLMSVPQVTKRIGRYLFTTPYAAAPTANVNGSGGGVNQTSQGYIDTFKTDFGTLMSLIPNRLQQTYTDAGVASTAAVFGLDPRYWRLSTLYGMKVDALGKSGLSHKKLIHTDWMLKCLLERANFGIFDITPTAAWTAT